MYVWPPWVAQLPCLLNDTWVSIVILCKRSKVDSVFLLNSFSCHRIMVFCELITYLLPAVYTYTMNRGLVLPNIFIAAKCSCHSQSSSVRVQFSISILHHIEPDATTHVPSLNPAPHTGRTTVRPGVL